MKSVIINGSLMLPRHVIGIGDETVAEKSLTKRKIHNVKRHGEFGIIFHDENLFYQLRLYCGYEHSIEELKFNDGSVFRVPFVKKSRKKFAFLFKLFGQNDVANEEADESCKPPKKK